jgi:hypothetical protein
VDVAAAAPDHRRGRVERSVFLGSTTRITLRVDDERVMLELPGRRDDLAPGAEVAIRIPARALLRLDTVA